MSLGISWGVCTGVEMIFGGMGELRDLRAVMIFAVQVIAVVFVSNGFLWLIYRKSEKLQVFGGCC